MIFSAPMIRALIREANHPGTGKTQTRRILKPQPVCISDAGKHSQYAWKDGLFALDMYPSSTNLLQHLPYRIGNRIWVREAHNFRGARYNDGTEEDPRWSDEEWFRVYGDGPVDAWDPEFPPGWEPSTATPVREMTDPEEDEGPDVRGLITARRSPIHMPRWASRLTLTVTDVRIERLQDISEADARAEGAFQKPNGLWSFEGEYSAGGPEPCRYAYRMFWEVLHGLGTWAQNPWIVALGFKVDPRNIDAEVTP